MDFGDAPDPAYPTLRVNDGARHLVQGPGLPWLGPVSDNPDIDPDGLPDPFAQGDDLFLPDDENGVTIPVLSPGVNSMITFEVFNGPAFVDGWIDFNKNGTWGDIPSELVVGGFYTTGIHNVLYTTPAIPAVPVPYNTFARFRINSSNPLSPTGFAFDGEVEDYMVKVEPMMWVGNVDSLWSNPANWNCNAVPDSTNHVIISGSSFQAPVVTGIDHCHHMVIEDGATVNVDPGAALTIHGNLDIGQGTSGSLIMYGGTTWVKGLVTSNPGASIDIQAGTFNARL